jgi:glycosyltransferase involved in cell wall biosynthesis
MRVALLQNFIAPYRVPLYERLQAKVAALRVFVSTRMESDRAWDVEWGTLDVVVQNNLTLIRPHRDELGFRRMLHLHIPYDTLPRLWRYRPDVVISVELGARTLQAAIHGMLRPSTRLLIWCKLSEHSERSWGRIRLLLRRFLLARADAVLVNGESGARYIARFGVPDHRIHRINQPVDVAVFAAAIRTRPETARTRLLCCGALSERKGVVPFLRELDLWARAHPDERLELWWLGDGDMRAALQAVPCAPNLAQRFLGAVPYADLPGWYAQADILAFPSLLDEWGLVVNEAMACGLPVLGSRYAQAVTELVEDGVNGWIFDPLSSHSVQGALERLRSVSPEDLVRMRTAARARIAALTPETAAAKIHDAIVAAAGPPRARAAARARPELAEPRPRA